MKTTKELRAWLLQRPRATALVAHTADGKEHRIECNGLTWARVAETVHALDALRLDSLGESGSRPVRRGR